MQKVGLVTTQNVTPAHYVTPAQNVTPVTYWAHHPNPKCYTFAQYVTVVPSQNVTPQTAQNVTPDPSQNVTPPKGPKCYTNIFQVILHPAGQLSPSVPVN